MNETFTYEYLSTRGISVEAFKFYGVLTKIDLSGKPVAMGFSYPSGSVKSRSYLKKEFRWTGEAKPELFGLDKFALGAAKAIIITEGELDAVSMWQATKTPSVSVRSAGSAVADVGSVLPELAALERIYLAFDNDAAGRAATAAVAKMFDHSRVFHVRFSNRKDANEYLQNGETEVLLNLVRNARPYVPENIICTFDQFKAALSKPKEGVSYPFPTLTKMTYGIRTGETVLIKAKEKVGKTAIMRAIEHHLLKETNDNVASFFIEEPNDQHLKALAGLELAKPCWLPDSGCTEDQISAAVEGLVQREERLHIYSHFGSDDPRSLLDTFRYLVTARACRYVLFDHISMAVSGLAGDEERRTLEFLATRLEILVKELDFALIMVSHVNDFGQTRGSHWLTKVADIVIDADRDTLAADDLTKRTIRLTIPYNRFCSSTGFAGNIVQDPDTYQLRESNDNEMQVSGLQRAA